MSPKSSDDGVVATGSLPERTSRQQWPKTSSATRTRQRQSPPDLTNPQHDRTSSKVGASTSSQDTSKAFGSESHSPRPPWTCG